MALEKSQGNVGAAIEALRKYVDVFQTDRDAWEELGVLYVQACLNHLCLLGSRIEGKGICVIQDYALGGRRPACFTRHYHRLL